MEMSLNDYVKAVSGLGPDLREEVKEQGYIIQRGVTNKMIESYAAEVLYENRLEALITQSKTGYTVQFTNDFIKILSGYLVNIGHAFLADKSKEVVLENVAIRTEVQKEEGMNPVQEIDKTVDTIPEKCEIEGKIQRSWLRWVDYLILLLRSAQWAFLIVLVGVFGQAFHIYHVVLNLSDLTGFAQVVNGLLWAVFLSFGLVYFSLKLGRVKMSEYGKVKKYKATVAWFVLFDVFANLYYWSYKFLLMPAVLNKYAEKATGIEGMGYGTVNWAKVDWLTFDITRIQWPQMIAALVLAFSIPFILKSFAGEIDLPASLDKLFRTYNEEKE